MQIQAEEKSTFDKSFISHKIFSSRNGVFLLPGEKSLKNQVVLKFWMNVKFWSINSFLRGKSYKRCKRMHELLALVFEILRFESYLTTRNWEVMGTTLQKKKDLECVKY